MFLFHLQPSVTQHLSSDRSVKMSALESNSLSSFWVGHCIIHKVKKSNEEPDTLEVKLDLHQSSSDFPEGLTTGDGHRITLNVIHRSKAHRYTTFCHEATFEYFRVSCNLSSPNEWVFFVVTSYKMFATKRDHVSPQTNVLSFM